MSLSENELSPDSYGGGGNYPFIVPNSFRGDKPLEVIYMNRNEIKGSPEEFEGVVRRITLQVRAAVMLAQIYGHNRIVIRHRMHPHYSDNFSQSDHATFREKVMREVHMHLRKGYSF